MANRLAHSLSPYLRQHADNPVDWWEWGPEALEEARRRDVPVFVSIGYAACHWCHVMAHESFSDPQIAALINEHTVPVKVDREEHPDVDAVYMNATVALTGQGGWPMSVFATPTGEPFWAGTYFPPVRRGGHPGFGEVVLAVAEAWQNRRDQVVAQADQISAALRAGGGPEVSGTPLAQILAAVAADFDPVHAGFGGAPKFPPTMVLDALLDSADPALLDLVRETLDAMAAGGIHDQLRGGFARYSVDRSWTVPHFEKMLYDNALLLETYARADLLWPGRCYREVATGIVDWLVAEMLTPDGGFTASLDADSRDESGDSVEGAFYVWTPAQLTAVLGEVDGRWAADLLGVTEDGTFEHRTSTLRFTGTEHDARWDDVRARLLEARAGRARPARDDKVVTAWNGWLISSLVYAGMVLDRPDWVVLAEGAADLLIEVHLVDGQLRRTSLDGQVSQAPGVLEDYGALALGLLRLASATGAVRHLARARQLLDVVDSEFAAEDGWFDSLGDGLWMRPRDVTDNATPSGTSSVLAAHRLLSKLDPSATRPALPQQAEALAQAAPRFAGWLLRDLIDRERPAAEIVVVGDAGDLLSREAWRTSGATSGIVTGRSDAPGWVALAGRPRVDGQPTAYVCRDFSCRLPVTEVQALREQLQTL